jgi:predicted DNA-binding protein YlxM (UPF0122 family)
MPTPDPTELVARQQRLLDVYGALLTEHQREACRLHLDEDWSFAELAQQFGCSRSAAHDLVRRAIIQLEHYESRLGHAAELARRDAVEEELRAQLAGLEASGLPLRGGGPGAGDVAGGPAGLEATS